MNAIAWWRAAVRRFEYSWTNGSEFSERLVDLWAYHQQVRLNFSRPGKSMDNAFIESINGTLREKCLNLPWFRSIDEAKETVEAWRMDYN